MYRSLLDFSLAYSRRGWHVYPVWSADEAGVCWCRGEKRHVPPLCQHPGKHPLPSRDFPSGYHSATTDEAVIRRRWTKGVTANIGMNPGRSGLIVVDVERDGLAEWDRLVTGRGQSPTLTAVTGGGGLHVYFRKPEGVGRVASPCGLWPGIDIRADDSGLVLPPSRSGKGAYRWLTPEDHPVAVCPGWVLEAIRGADGGKPGPKADRPSTARISVPAAVPADPEADDPFVFVVGGGELDGHPGSPDGERRETFLRLAGVQLRRGDDVEAVREAGYRWADRCSPAWEHRKVDHHIEGMVSKQGRDTGTTPFSPSSQGPPPEPGKEGSLPELDGPGLGEGLVPSFLPSPAAGVMGGRGEVVAGDPDPSPDSGVTITELDGSELAPAAADGRGPSAAGRGEGDRLPADALYGVLGEYVRAVAPLTEADPAGVLACLLTGVGSVLGRGTHHRIGRRHSANLFTLLVGGTASRKGTCWSVGDALLSLADPGWHSACVEGGFGSGQGLVYRIRDPRGDDDGVTDKRLLVVEEEFAKPLRLCRSETSILSPLVRNAFDGVKLSVLNRGDNAYSVAEPHVSVVGMTTGEELRELTKGRTELVNGTLNRFLVVAVSRAGYLPCGGDYYGAAEGFAGRLAGALRAAAGVPFPARLSPEAASLWEAEYVRLERLPEAGGDYGKAVGRLSVHCLKLALIYAALDGANVIGEAHLRAALALVNYADRSARDLFTDPRPTGPDRSAGASAAEPPLAVRLHGIISESPGVKRSELLRAVREPAAAVGEALAWLTAAGMAHPGSCRSGGREAVCWYPGAGEAGTTLPPLLSPEDPDPDPGEGRKEGSLPPAAGPEAASRKEGRKEAPPGADGGPDPGILPSFPPSGDDRGGEGEVVPAPPDADVPLTADAILSSLTAPVGGDAKASRGWV